MLKLIHSKSCCFAAACIIHCLFSGCYETYIGLEMDLSGVDKVVVDKRLVTDEYLPVRVALNDPSYRPATRGLGAFDVTRPQRELDSIWNNATFYLYAFRRDGVGSFAETVGSGSDSYTCLLDNEEAYVEDRNSLLLSFRKNNKYGHPIYWNDEKEFLPYMFFGYYLDDAKVEMNNRTADSISLFLTIDGSQDLLCGKSKITPRQEELISKSANPSYMRTYNYSAYTARRNLFPVLDLKHALCRFRFTIFPNDERCENITVDSIKISMYNHVEMVVAHRDTAKVGCRFFGDKTLLAAQNTVDGSNRLIYELDGEILPFQLKWDESYRDIAVYSRPGLVCGENLMIPPDSVYVLHTYTTQFHTESGDLVAHEYEDELRLSGGKPFQQGEYYNIRISVGGLQQIMVQASIIQWQNGEDINSTITHE